MPKRSVADMALPTLTVEGRYVRDPASDLSFARKRIPAATAVELTEQGLLRSDGQLSRTWHLRTKTLTSQKSINDRAILVQSVAHIDDIHAQFKDGKLREALPRHIAGGAFGENLLVSGVSADDLCIGDILQMVATSSKRSRADEGDGDATTTRVLQVTSPRRPCSSIDQRFGKTWNGGGVRAFCARSGRAGFFCRVVQPCSLPRDGVQLKVVERPHPSWPLSRVSALLYGADGVCNRPDGYRLPGFDHVTASGIVGTGGGRDAVLAAWRGTEEELASLARLPELAFYEWKDGLEAMLAECEKEKAGRFSGLCAIM